MEDHEAVMFASLISVRTVEREKVLAVVARQYPSLPLRSVKQVGVGEPAQRRYLLNGRGIVTAHTKLLGDVGREHLIQQEFHASVFCSRRHSSSAASASSTLRAMRSSISAGYSA